MSTLAERMIEFYKDKFDAADRRKTKTMFTAAGRTNVHSSGEKTLYLPNGVGVKVTTDESGTATQVEEDEALHAIVRPKSIRAGGFVLTATRPRIDTSARPISIRAANTITRPGGKQ